MTALPLEPHTEAQEATLARFEAAEPAFRETTVDTLDRSHFGLCVSTPERAAVGYLYAVHDDFNDGYPSRLIVLVDDEGGATELEFTDSDPAGYPKTMRTPCLVENVPAVAIEAMRGPSPAEEALTRVEALAEEHEEWARINSDLASRFSAQGDLVTEQYHLGLKQAQEVSADRIRAAIAAPVAGQHTTDEEQQR